MSVSLKVLVVDQKNTKTMQFASNMTLGEVCKEIKEKLGETAAASDHGLFLTAQRKWLANNRTLDFYDLRSGDEVQYKKRHRALRVRMLDETMKTILIDESKAVYEVVAKVCEHIGLSNPEEYSFQAEASVVFLTKEEAARIKKKQSNDKPEEALKWLNPDKTLPEQGLEDTDIVVLKKKFFYSDQNIDRNDAVQVNLVYVQCRDMIVSGKIPCKLDEAIQLASLQCQVQFGNHEPDKHKPGFINIKDFMPPEYQKDKKDVEKKIYIEHRKLQGLNELSGKFRYVQLCRSLKTYGVTFFTVKEKMLNKNKLVVILLGVTRDSIMRVDAESKEILKTWPLTTLRRWAAAPNSFTLDFGDYADAYYSVQTTDGEQISRLIGGYIDIIIKKRKETTRVTQDEEEQVAVSEETMRPVKASGITVAATKAGRAVEVHVAAAGSVSTDGSKIGTKMSAAKKGTVMGVADYSVVGITAGSAQQALMQNINSGYAAINVAAAEMTTATQLPPLGNDAASQQWKQQTMDVNKQTIAAQIGAHLAATAALVNLTGVSDLNTIDFQDVGANIASLSSNLNQIASSTKMLAALVDPSQGDKILEAARALASCTGKVLTSVQPMLLSDGEMDPRVRSEVLTSGSEVSKLAYQLLFRMGETDISQQAQQELIDAAKAVAHATIQLVTTGAKPISTHVANIPKFQDLRAPMVIVSKQAANAAETLVTCTMVAAPGINMSGCQDRVWEGTLFLKDAVNALNDVCAPVIDSVGKQSRLAQDLAKASQKVNEAVAKLIDKTKNPHALGSSYGGDKELDGNLDSVEAAIKQLQSAKESPTEIVNGAKALTMATTAIVNMLKARAADEKLPEDEKNRLLGASKLITDATAKMVAAAKDAARNPTDPEKHAALQATVENLHQAMMVASGDASRKRIYVRLTNIAKQAAASSNQLVAASKAAAPSNRNQQTVIKLNNSSKKATDSIGALVSATRAHVKEPEDSALKLKLVAAAKQVIEPIQGLIESAKAASTTTGDESARTQLVVSARQTEDDVKALIQTLGDAESANAGMEFNTAMDTLKTVQKTLVETEKNLAAGTLKPTVLQNIDGAVQEITGANKVLAPAVAQLVAAANQGDEKFTGTAARDSVSALQSWTNGVASLIAAAQDEPDMQKQLLVTANTVTNQLTDLVQASKKLVDLQHLANAPADVITLTQQEVAEKNRKFGESQAAIMELMPGRRDVDHASTVIKSGVEKLAQAVSAQVPPGDTIQNAQNRLNSAAAALAVASNALVSASRNNNPADLKASSQQMEKAFNSLITSAQAVLAQTSDENSKNEVNAYVKEVASNSASLLGAIRASFADGSNVGVRMKLNAAAKLMSDSISKLVEACTSSSPGVAECNRADQVLIAANAVLDTYLDPAMAERTESYFDCLKNIIDATKIISSSVNNVAAAAKTGDQQKTGGSLLDASSAILALSGQTARSAYLIGISDPSSVAAVPGTIDASVFAVNSQEVRSGIQALLDPNATQQQVLAAAGSIAKNTAALCNTSKNVSQNPKLNAFAKQQFGNFAKNIAANTANLVQSIKLLAAKPSDETRAEATTNSNPLLETMDQLIAFAASPEFAPVSAQISPVAQRLMEPVVASNRTLISAASDAISTAKSICTGRVDQDALQMLNNQVKGVADALRMLVNTVKQTAPGQKDCDEAIDKVTSCISDLDGAILQADVDSLTTEGATAGGDQVLRDSLLDNSKALQSLVGMIGTSGEMSGAGQLGAAIQQLASNFQPTTATAVSFAATMSEKNAQKQVLDGIKTIADNILNFLNATKEAAVDPSATQNLDSARSKLEKAMAGVIGRLEGSAEGTQELNRIIEDVSNALRNVNIADEQNLKGSLNNLAQEGASYPALVSEINKRGKKMAELVGEIVSKSGKPTSEAIAPLAEQLGKFYQILSEVSGKAGVLINEADARVNLQDAARELGGGTMKLIESMKASLISANSNPNGTVDNVFRQKLNNAAREVSQSLSKLMTVAKEGSKGMVACEQAIAQCGDISSDLESTMIFAQAGQLDPLDSKESFAAHKDNIEKYARDLVEQSKSIVANAASGNQDDLAASARAMVALLEQLREASKKGATAITSSEKHMQESLLKTAQSVALNLSKLITAALDTSGRPLVGNGTGTGKAVPEVMKLRDAAKNLVTEVGDLIKIVKVVGDESSRGVRTLQSAGKEVEELLASLAENVPASGTALPEEVAGLAKSIAATTANLVSASSRTTATNQDELIGGVSENKRYLQDLFRAGKAATSKAPDEQKRKMYDALRALANAQMQLFDSIKVNMENSTPIAKAAIQKGARDVSTSVNGVVEAASELIPGGYVDPNDPNVIAERELLAAASSIEAAAKKLSQLKPPERPTEANQDLPFEQQILEAAKAIAAATAALVKSATAAQREIVAAGANYSSKELYHQDSQWAEGLVSGAKEIASATGDLCEAANAAVKGEVQRERVIASARNVSASTVSLLASASTRSDNKSPAQVRLRAAGKAVTAATDQLVKAAEQSMAFEEQINVNELMNDNTSNAKKRAAELDAQARILQMEKELENARNRLTGLRKGRYNK